MADIETTSRPPSFASLVAELNPGECVAKVRQVNPTIPVGRLAEELPEIRQQCRNSVAGAVERAKRLTGATYTVESGDCVTAAGNLYVVAIIRRKDDR